MPEDINLDQIKQLVKLVEKHQLAELTVEEEGVTITIKGACGAETPMAQPHFVHAAAPQPEAAPVEAEEEPAAELEMEEEGDLVRIESPMVGVFYRTPSPDAPPFVEVGDTIEIGQTIGLIEAMKVFSEIPSEVAGIVVDIPAQNTKLVQQGDPLVVVRVTEEA